MALRNASPVSLPASTALMPSLFSAFAASLAGSLIAVGNDSLKRAE